MSTLLRGWPRRVAGPTLLLGLGLAATPERASAADEEAESSRSNKSQPDEMSGSGTRLGGLAFDNKGITYRTGDGLFEANIGGRLHLDFGGGEGRGAALGERSLWRGQVRRAWGELALTYDRVLTFGLQVDAAGGDEPIYDLALGYSGLDPFVVTVGNFKEPFSLEQLQSNNETSFMERSLADALVPARNVGLAVGANGNRWTAAAGIFGGNINTGVADGGVAGTGRVTYSPILDRARSRVVHFGVAGSYRSLDKAASFSVGTTPESAVYDSSIIGFDAFRGARSLKRLGLEAAVQHGPFRAQAEYIAAQVERDGLGGGPRRSATFQGGYVHATYVLTGQARSYEFKPKYGTSYAVFGGVELADKDRVSSGGTGAWEVGARYSALTLGSGGLRGGVEHNATLGLTWYPDRNLRVVANYVRAFGSDLLGEGRRADVDIVQVRLQLAF